MPRFKLVSSFAPKGDQPQAIEALARAIHAGEKHQVLLGITGSGKTFTIANVIEKVQKPTLIISHNKTLAAQLYGEFRDLFPENAVRYFVSYYDYYQPEAYVPSSDTFIEKESIVNEEIDRMRHAATQSLLTRSDVIIVASVSCIYGLGAAKSYFDMAIHLARGAEYPREALLRDLVGIRYERNDLDFHRGTFRARGDTVEIFPAYEEEHAIRVEYFGDGIERIVEFDPLRGRVVNDLEKMTVFPGSHYVTPEDQLRVAIAAIREEVRERLTQLKGENKLLEAQRLEQRTMYDLEMLEQMGWCHGIENYSRHLSGRAPGEPPPCLLDYFPKDFLIVIDESHQTVPQLGAMYRGDRSRKQVLVEYGFRLPSALDNRPLQFEEFQGMVSQAVYVSATPADYEFRQTGGEFVEQVIRPTGLMDPEVEVRPVGHQVDDLLEEIRVRAEKKERVLVTTLTKRMAEDLTEYYTEVGVRVRYLHSDIETLERTDLIRDLRKGVYDVLVGINLLREGLDLPEVSLVAILDADKEGFLRSSVSLIQTIGRAARNVAGKVIMYADRVTDSMRKALDATAQRRDKQRAYNAANNITPQTVVRAILDLSTEVANWDYAEPPLLAAEEMGFMPAREEVPRLIAELSAEMRRASEAEEFEKAGELRDRILALKDWDLGIRPSPSAPDPRKRTAGMAKGRDGAGGPDRFPYGPDSPPLRPGGRTRRGMQKRR